VIDASEQLSLAVGLFHVTGVEQELAGRLTVNGWGQFENIGFMLSVVPGKQQTVAPAKLSSPTTVKLP
jgi:hypothetical protein